MKKNPRPMPEVIISDRATPICNRKGHKSNYCYIVENPSHWVDVELAPPYKYAPELLATLRAIVARIDGVFDDPNLIDMGPLETDHDADVLKWANNIIAKAEVK